MGHTGTHAINATLYTDLKFDPVKDFAPITGARHVQQHPDRSGGEPGQVGRRAGRLCQDQARGLELRLAGRRHRRASARRAARQARRRQSRSRALSRHRAGGDRHGRGPDGHAVRGLSLQRPACGGAASSGCSRSPARSGIRACPICRPWPEAGYPEVQMEQWFGLFAPAKTPAPIVQKLNAEFVKALQSDDVRDKVAAAGRLCACRPRRTSLARWSRATSSGSGRW